MKRLTLVGLLALTVALSGTAYAEVQNIKVSGDLDVKAITHHNYDLKLKQKNESGVGAVGPITNDDDESFALSTLHINVDADLTDNVSTSVRLLNQRKWDNFTSAPDQITIDNAYVTLKEFLYNPLTLVVGRQNLHYGSQFIVGDGLLADPNGVFPATDSGPVQPTGQEYSAFNSFDAIRAILDYSPLTVEAVWAKVNETGVPDNDETLYGVVANYKMDRWNAEIEPYWFFKDDQSGAKTVTVNDAVSLVGTPRSYESNQVHTVGLRLAGSPIENLKLSGEGAHQFGTLIDVLPKNSGITQAERNRSAWAANVYANYTWAQAPLTPSTGVGWTFYSGNPAHGSNGFNQDNVDRNDTFNAWDPVYRGSFTTFIQDFLSGADAPANLYTTFDANDTNATTNRHLIYGDMKLSPMKDVTLWARYTHARFDKAPRPGRSHHAGDEIDVKALYDYTEDVQLNVYGGWFLPGKYYDEPTSSARSKDLAWTVGAGGAVKF